MTFQQYRSGNDNNAQPSEDEATESVDSGPVEIDEEGRGSVDSEYLVTGREEDSESVGAAAAALQKAQKRQRQGDDPLQKELRMLERNLGIMSNNNDSKESARARAKLRSELEADGFDAELLDILVRSKRPWNLELNHSFTRWKCMGLPNTAVPYVSIHIPVYYSVKRLLWLDWRL